jgi:hypothetical protein
VSSTPPAGSWSEPNPDDPRLAETQPLAGGAPPEKPPEKPPVGQHREGIEYLAAYREVPERPDWVQPVIIGGLVGLIPILGPLLQFGYMYELVELRHRWPRAHYPAFDINRFTPYLARGVWPFLVWFIMQWIGSSFLPLFVQVPMFILLAIGEQNPTMAIIVGLIVVPFILLVLVAFTVGFMLISTPLMLRGGLTQDPGKMFDMNWTKDFWRRMWKEILLIDLFVMFTGLVLGIVGLMLCCVGALFANMYVTIAYGLLTLQLYELYLSRGGEPIPLKPPAGERPLPPPLMKEA